MEVAIIADTCKVAHCARVRLKTGYKVVTFVDEGQLIQLIRAYLGLNYLQTVCGIL